MAKSLPEGTSRLPGMLRSWPRSWTEGRSPRAWPRPCPAPRHGQSDQHQGSSKSCAESSGMSCRAWGQSVLPLHVGFVPGLLSAVTKKPCSPTKMSCAVSPHLVAALATCPCCSISPHQLVPALVTCPCSFRHPKMFLQLGAEGLQPCLASGSVRVLLDITSLTPNRSREPRCCCCLIAIYFSHSSSPHRHYVKNAFHINPNFSICRTGLKRSEGVECKPISPANPSWGALAAPGRCTSREHFWHLFQLNNVHNQIIPVEIIPPGCCAALCQWGWCWVEIHCASLASSAWALRLEGALRCQELIIPSLDVL